MEGNTSNTTFTEIPLVETNIQVLPLNDPNSSPQNGAGGGNVAQPSAYEKNKGTTSTDFMKECFVNLYLYFLDFCDNTSINGFKFVSERGRFLIEKLWWLIMVVLALFGSFSLISDAYSQWTRAPVVVTFAMTETPIWKIPFPAVTICPKINANPEVFNYSDVYQKHLKHQNTTEEENKYFELFSMICNKQLEFIEPNKTEFITEKEYKMFLKAFAKIDAKSCSWLGSNYNCDSILSDTLTEEGWCRTFNMLHSDDIYVKSFKHLKDSTMNSTRVKLWNLETGYSPMAETDAYPMRTMLAGVDGGFEIVIFVNHEELDYSCVNLQGFKVTLHHPAEEPNMGKYFRLPLDQAVVVGITPRMITTDPSLESYLPSKRKCYFQGEKFLNNFKVYTQDNCMDECLRNYTLQICKCTPFNDADQEHTICGAGSRGCMQNAKVNFFRGELLSKTNSDYKSNECNCLPSCTSLEFEVETSQADWEWRKSQRSSDYVAKSLFDKNHLSKLQIYYKDMQFLTSHRHELYSQIDFLANCGGLLGLFCGFSFLSFVEIIYYLSLRLVCNFKKFGYKFWSGDKDLITNNFDDKSN